MSIRTPLARAKGKGSSHSGNHHWIMERVSSVVLVPLVIWFIYSVLKNMGNDYYDAVNFFASPINAVLMALVVIASFYHTALGLQVVIEDYVHAKWKKTWMLLIIKAGLFVLGLASVLAIAKLHLGV